MMDTLQEALAAFDDPCKKCLDYHHVSAALSQLPDEIRRSFKAQAEILAMELREFKLMDKAVQLASKIAAQRVQTTAA